MTKRTDPKTLEDAAEIGAPGTTPTDPLAKLREPFPPHQISKLPKETKQQAAQRKAEQEKGNWPAKCQVCDGYHHAKAVHLDYVGHAALTDRLLDTDPHWSWEPLAFRDGLPAFDPTGGLWIKLTVCGVTRLGYGHAAAKPGMDPGAREKEVIGDALRNAAMRFGAALDLWHKGDLHLPEEPDAAPAEEPKARPQKADAKPSETPSGMVILAGDLLRSARSKAEFAEIWNTNRAGWKDVMSKADYAAVVEIMHAEAARWSEPKAEPEPETDDFGDIDFAASTLTERAA